MQPISDALTQWSTRSIVLRKQAYEHITSGHYDAPHEGQPIGQCCREVEPRRPPRGSKIDLECAFLIRRANGRSNALFGGAVVDGVHRLTNPGEVQSYLPAHPSHSDRGAHSGLQIVGIVEVRHDSIALQVAAQLADGRGVFRCRGVENGESIDQVRWPWNSLVKQEGQPVNVLRLRVAGIRSV